MSEETVPPVDRSRRCTTSGNPITEETTKLKENGQQNDYVILCEEERKKGFVRPVRRTYKHVGIRPKYPTVDLTAEQLEHFKDYGYVKFEKYPEGSSSLGRYWTAKQLSSGCGAVTSMSQSIAETYARDPKFYGGTFCIGCGTHLPVEEFVWIDDGQVVGS